MASKFHNGPKGPSPCTARKRACPLGGEHYSTLGGAQAAYEKVMGTAQGLFKSLKRGRAGEAMTPEGEAALAREAGLDRLTPEKGKFSNGPQLALTRPVYPQVDVLLREKLAALGLERFPCDVTLFAPKSAVGEWLWRMDPESSRFVGEAALKKFEEEHPPLKLSGGAPPDPLSLQEAAEAAGLPFSEAWALREEYEAFLKPAHGARVQQLLGEGKLFEITLGGEPYILALGETPSVERKLQEVYSTFGAGFIWTFDGPSQLSNRKFLSLRGEDPEFRLSVAAKLEEAGAPDRSLGELSLLAPKSAVTRQAGELVAGEGSWRREPLEAFRAAHPELPLASDKLSTPEEVDSLAMKAGVPWEERRALGREYSELFQSEGEVLLKKLLEGGEGASWREFQVAGEPYLLKLA